MSVRIGPIYIPTSKGRPEEPSASENIAALIGFLLASLLCIFMIACPANAQINYMRVANLDRWNDGYATHGCQHGDVNSSVWAADDKVYMVSDDTQGYATGSPCTSTTGVGLPGLLRTQFSRWNSDRSSPTRSVNGWDTTFDTMMTAPSNAYGATFSPAYSWKATNALAYNGKIFTIQCWQQYGGVQPSGPCSIVYTSDLTNFISPNGTNATPPVSSTATLVGTTAQNFVIVLATNDTLSITIDGGSPQTIVLVAGTKTAAQIATNINLTLTGATASAAGAYVKIVSATTGASSSVAVGNPSHSARTTLGLPTFTVTGNITFGQTYRSGVPFWVLYGKEGSTAPSVDNASTRAYFTSCDNGTTALWNNGNQCRLGYITLSDLDATPFDTTKQHYYNTALGGCTSSTTDAACFETTDASATAIITETGHMSMSAPFFVPQQKIAGSATGAYLWPQWYFAANSGPLHGTVSYWTASTLAGPWTNVSSQSEPEKGFYNLSPWQPSVYDTSNPFVTVTTSGDWVSATAGLALSDPFNLYNIFFMDLELSTVPFPSSSITFVHLPRSTRFGIAEGTSRATEFQLFYDFSNTASGATVPDLSGNAHTGTFTAPTGTGPGAMSSFRDSAGLFASGVTSTHVRPLTVMVAYIHRINRVGAIDDPGSDERVFDVGNPMRLRRTGTTVDSFTGGFASTEMTNASMTDFVWHIVYNRWNADGSMTQYTDGVQSATSAGTTSTSSSAAITLGGIPGFTGFELNGLLRAYYIRNRAMTNQEIIDETTYWQSQMKRWAETTK